MPALSGFRLLIPQEIVLTKNKITNNLENILRKRNTNAERLEA